MIERCVSASRCSSASAAVSSSSEPTTRARRCAESSPMISARSEGCSRARRFSETASWICVGLRSCSGATLSQAISVRGSAFAQRTGRGRRRPSRRTMPPKPMSAATTRIAPPVCATSMSLMRTTLRPSTSTICLSKRSSTRVQRLVVGRARSCVGASLRTTLPSASKSRDAARSGRDAARSCL